MATAGSAHAPGKNAPKKLQPLRGAEERNALAVANDGLAFAFLLRMGVGQADPRFDDLLQECRLGLLRAAECFDASRGFQFSTYAECWMHCYFRRALRRLALVRVPDWVSGPALAELSGLLTPFSLDRRRDGHLPHDPAAPGEEPALDRDDEARALREALACPGRLRPRLALAVRMRHLEGRRLREVGEALGVSKERARQIIKQGVKALRAMLAGR